MSKRKKITESMMQEFLYQAAIEDRGAENVRFIHFANDSSFSAGLRLETIRDGEVTGSSFKRLESRQRWTGLQLKGCLFRIKLEDLIFDIDINEGGFDYFFMLDEKGGCSIGRSRSDGKEDTTVNTWPKPLVYKKQEDGSLMLLENEFTQAPEETQPTE